MYLLYGNISMVFIGKHLKRGLKEIKLDTFYSTVKQETSNCNKSAV